VGAIGGLVTALEQAATPLVLVVACDLPFLEEPVLRLLVDRARAADGAWVRTSRGPEPLLACYRSSTAPLIRAAIARGERRLSSLDRILQLEPVTDTEIAALGVPSRALTNINTPDDLARIQ
jgi:molybdopterin-guanine dinucleotide biosynthesis protein A